MKPFDVNLFFENFPVAPEKQLSLMEEYHQKYPSSHFVTFFYLKMLQEKSPKKFELLKSKLLLSIFNRKEFHQAKLDFSSHQEHIPAESDEITKLAEQFQQIIPKIKYDPDKHNAEIDMAELGEVEDIEFISETLAMVYVEQGYTGKAIQMLKKLMVQNPEKNTYFAALIEKVKISVNLN
ncbi:MAG: hypothetical protein LBI45_03420 [Bacteroidales bacterium]|jgi:predicted RNA-binding protein Jag|nr:hypothetical protein [Bacteroidales bacterium]